MSVTPGRIALPPRAYRYLIWSNEHVRWWSPCSCGYTGIIALAGRYEKAEAAEICANANRFLPAAHGLNEVMVLAPECIE
jgi:hypothetical protein